MKLSACIIFLIVILLPIKAEGVALMEPGRSTLLVTYENGDTAAITCPKGDQSCYLNLLVNKVEFHFSASDLGGLDIEPSSITLFSGSNSGRDKYFSFEISIICPEISEEGPFYDCSASVLIEQDKEPVVRLLRKTMSRRAD